MSFAFRADQSLVDNLHRIFRKQMEAGLAVAQGGIEPNDTRVHAIRRHLKRARAVLHLVRREIGRNSFRRQNHWLRDIARSIQDIRDAEVRLYTMRQLEDEIHHHSRSYQKIERLLAAELKNFNAAFDGWEGEAIRLLNKARDAAEKWSIGCYETEDFRDALQRSYRGGCKSLIAVLAIPSVPNLHDLRKQVKRLGYQLHLLRSASPPELAVACDDLTRLGDLLGEIHDLSFLAERLRQERGEPHWGVQDEQLLVVIHGKQAQLESNGIKIGACFFEQRPNEFGSRIKRWVTDWTRQTNHSIPVEQLTAG